MRNASMREQAARAKRAPTVTVAICTHDADRWPWLCEAIESIRSQSREIRQLVVVVDHNDGLSTRARDAFPDALVVDNVRPSGLAGARNTALTHATGDVVAFLDDDAVADPEWLERLVHVYDDSRVVGAGGSVLPAWPFARPRWFPVEFDWVVGCSWSGLPDHVAPVRNPIGAGMSFRREAFALVGPFTDGIGRGGGDAMGCEETEFTIRLRQARPGAVVLYVPEAAVRHHVDERRTSWSYFVTRCRAEGRSKALVASSVGSRDALASERSYSTRVLPRAVKRGLREATHGDGAGALRAGVILAGLAITATGYAEGRVRPYVRRLRAGSRR